MSEAKFTNGEWSIVDNNGQIEIAELVSDWHICYMFGRSDDGMHDAHLIAAAPEMYEMLKKMKAVMSHLSHEPTLLECKRDAASCSVDEIDVLLAKARGEK